jgi:hypothetical protein
MDAPGARVVLRAPGADAAYFDTTLMFFDVHGANDALPANCIRK